VRYVIDPSAPSPSYTGLVGFGGATRGSGLAPTDGTMRMSFGRRAFFGYRVTGDGTAEWFANLPKKMAPTADQLRASQAVLVELRKAFTGDRTPAADLIAGSDPSSLVTVGLLEIMPSLRHPLVPARAHRWRSRVRSNSPATCETCRGMRRSPPTRPLGDHGSNASSL
jgi:hypothetical protein